MAGSTAIDPVLVERFKVALDRLNPDGRRIGLAVSGGPDSMAMLLLAHAAIPGAFEVATVDHGLRPEAKDECALVVAACEERGVPCEVLRVQVGEGNVQAMAREARYDALGAWAGRAGIIAVATAHHADDQAETLLMRLNRGSGVSGLAGVRRETSLEFGPEIALVRPLLQFRRNELAAVIDRTQLAVVHDSSNRDERFDRVRIRQALARADWLDPLAIAQSAQHLADAEEALETCARILWGERVHLDGESRTYTMDPHNGWEMDRRLAGRIIGSLGGRARGSDVARLVERLSRGESGNLAGVLAEARGGKWVFRPEPPRKTG